MNFYSKYYQILELVDIDQDTSEVYMLTYSDYIGVHINHKILALIRQYLGSTDSINDVVRNMQIREFKYE